MEVEVIYAQEGETSKCDLCEQPMDIEKRGTFRLRMPVAFLVEKNQRCCKTCLVDKIGGAYAEGFLSIHANYAWKEVDLASSITDARTQTLERATEDLEDAASNFDEAKEFFLSQVERIIGQSLELLELRGKEVMLRYREKQAREKAHEAAQKAVPHGFIWSAEKDAAEKRATKATKTANQLQKEVAQVKEEIAQKEAALRKKLLGEVASLEGALTQESEVQLD